jgi:hypothetical protein
MSYFLPPPRGGRFFIIPAATQAASAFGDEGITEASPQETKNGRMWENYAISRFLCVFF